MVGQLEYQSVDVRLCIGRVMKVPVHSNQAHVIRSVERGHDMEGHNETMQRVAVCMFTCNISDFKKIKKIKLMRCLRQTRKVRL